jgi:hypothetical protein
LFFAVSIWLDILWLCIINNTSVCITSYLVSHLHALSLLFLRRRNAWNGYPPMSPWCFVDNFYYHKRLIIFYMDLICYLCIFFPTILSHFCCMY